MLARGELVPWRPVRLARVVRGDARTTWARWKRHQHTNNPQASVSRVRKRVAAVGTGGRLTQDLNAENNFAQSEGTGPLNPLVAPVLANVRTHQ